MPRAGNKKVLIFSSGTRGDAQPMAALAVGLQRHGFTVRIGMNVNHVTFLQGFGLDAFACGTDMEKLFVHDPEMRASVASGNVMGALRSIAAANKADFPQCLARKIKEIDTWKPDVVLTHLLEFYEISPLAASRGIPCVFLGLQSACPSSNVHSALGEPEWVPHRMAGNLLIYLLWMSERGAKDQEIKRQAPEILPYLSQTWSQFMHGLFRPVTPAILGVSPGLNAVQEDWPAELRERVVMTGAWVIDGAEQKVKMDRKDPQFGGADMAKLEAFLAKGRPIYMGWGSMTSVSETHMACLAVRSLMAAKLRGVILGGWARLRPEHLECQADTQAMKNYAKDNVLFVDSAPHEWLFQRCAALVHHGGAGTLAAAMRSGVPSVVTPCAFDQMDNAKIVAGRGAGIAMRQFSEVKVADLAAAITKCTTDAGLIERARALGEALSKEAGVAHAVRVLDDFLVDEVATGQWRANFDRSFAEHRALAPRKWFSFGCCMEGPGGPGYEALPSSTE